MNKWDKVFWMLFILLEAAIIIGNIWFFTPIGIILGFALVAVAFARFGDYLFHKEIRDEIGNHKETMSKMKSWLNNQYELTHGIKNLHDHRFHKIEKGKIDVDEKLEKNYREIVGKVIELENRLNLVSRAVISSAKNSSNVMVVEKPAERIEKPVSNVMDAFEKVWDDIISLADKKKSISTLSRGVKNKILKVRDDAIVLRSEMTKKERTILKTEFEHFWKTLSRKKSLDFLKDVEDPKMVRMGSIIISFLARLPYVEHQLKPRVLYLMDENTHNLGTLKTYKTI